MKTKSGPDVSDDETISLIQEGIVEKFGLRENINILMFVFDELICNIQQHSKSVFNCFQARLYGSRLAVSLIDTGISIPQSYLNAGYTDENEMTLFSKAFDGVSVKKDRERGTGIPSIYNCICKGLKGSLFIISRKCAFKKLSGEDSEEFVDLKSENFDLEFEGTIINMLFEKPEKKIDFYHYLTEHSE